MSSYFCKKCGYENLYSFSKPNFCGNCSETLGPTIQASAKPNSPSSRKKFSVEMEEDEEVVRKEYNLEVEVGEALPKITLGEIAHQPKTGFVRPKGKAPTGKKLISQIDKEFSSSRSRPIEI